MDIGLYTGAMTLTGHVGGQNMFQEPESLTPIPGILDAPNVVILGASIMDASFGAGGALNAPIAAYAAAAGFTGTLHTRSHSGDKIDDTILVHNAVAAEPTISATTGQNLYVVHTGGNNVSASRPWPGGQSDFETGYQTLMAQIMANGDKVIPLPLTKRLYPDSPTVLHGDVASEVNGSKPYNENIIHPAIATHAPDWRGAPDVPYVNPYETSHRYPQLLSADGIHGFSAALSRYILARIAARARGQAQSQSRAGTSLIYSIQKGEPNNMTVGTLNLFQSYGNPNQPFQNNPLLCGAITTDGTFDPFISLLTNDTFQSNSNNAGTGTFSRIPDTRFHDPQLVNNGIYLQSTHVYTLHFDNLTPGDMVTVTAVGVRDAAGTNRRGTATLSTGETLELDAANDASSNQITFSPVSVPESGRISFELSVAPGSTYAYLHGIALDFS